MKPIIFLFIFFINLYCLSMRLMILSTILIELFLHLILMILLLKITAHYFSFILYILIKNCDIVFDNSFCLICFFDFIHVHIFIKLNFFLAFSSLLHLMDLVYAINWMISIYYYCSTFARAKLLILFTFKDWIIHRSQTC